MSNEKQKQQRQRGRKSPRNHRTDQQPVQQHPPQELALPDLPLQSSWSLYFHKAFDNDWSKESYKHIYTVNTVRLFWRLINNLPKYNIIFWFFMRDDHPPIWEDKANEGCGWLYRFPKDSTPTPKLALTTMNRKPQPAKQHYQTDSFL